MLQATVKKSDISYFIGQTLSSVRVSEFMISLFFGFDRQMDIVTHWELVNATTNALIDRATSIKNREQFYLLNLIGVKLIRYTKTSYQVDLEFENNLKLIVY
jgi:hypothetical protein